MVGFCRGTSIKTRLGKVGTGLTYFPFHLQPGRLNKKIANRLLLEPRCTCSISSSRYLVWFSTHLLLEVTSKSDGDPVYRYPPCYWQSQPDFDQKLFLRRFSYYDFKWDQALPSHVHGKSWPHSYQFWNRIFGLQQYSVSDFLFMDICIYFLLVWKSTPYFSSKNLSRRVRKNGSSKKGISFREAIH